MLAMQQKVTSYPFGQRLTEICDANPNVPPHNYGRLGWIREQLEKRYNDKVSIETVRKWLGGEGVPKPSRITNLARLLDVDESWLALGVAPNMTPRERRLKDSEADGAVLTVAGLIKMAGGHPAFPTEDDERANREAIDVYAIIRGAQYAMHIALAREAGDAVVFSVPPKYELVMQIGVLPLSDFAIRMVEIPEEYIVEHGHRRGGSIDVTVPKSELPRFEIKTLRERL